MVGIPCADDSIHRVINLQNYLASTLQGRAAFEPEFFTGWFVTADNLTLMETFAKNVLFGLQDLRLFLM